MARNALIIFIKNPIKGRVKTRIAKETNNEKALEIYNELLAHTQKECAKVDAVKILYYSSFVEEKDMWDNEIYQKKRQSQENLGLKMFQAIKDELKYHNKVVLVGSDIGELTSDIIDGAFKALESSDIVIGPALDGGYYLVAMKNVNNIFEDIDWSTDKVLDQTIEQIDQLNIKYSLLDSLSDIDFIEDYNSWKTSTN